MSQRILVVDDSPTIRRVVGRTLSQAGYEVCLAVDGREALEKAQAEVPDLVLVDFVMPHMNGLRFVQAMRQVANLASVPVVLMSAKADKIGDGFVAQTGALDAITKPFSPEALLAVTGHALSRWGDESIRRDTEPPPSPVSVERISSVPPSSAEPPPETSPAALAASARTIASRLAGALAGRVDGVDAEALEEAIASSFEPASLFTLVRELSNLVPGRDGEHSLEGRLEHVPLGEILQLLTHQRQTGVLEVDKQPSSSNRSVTICLKDGAVSLALGHVQEAEFRLGRYLLREELIDREDLERMLRQRGPRGLLGTHLVKLGYISADELTKVLVQQTSELIYEALRWRRGRYRFLRFASRPEAVDARLGLPLASLLMEGLRRVDEWRLIEEQLRSFDVVLRPDEEALRFVDASRFSADERAVLAAIDGERTVREIVEHTRMASFEACKILFQLLTSRLVREQR
jgi:CheY-like chemotaxis protein